jgi:Leucine-rich repeat (LRR) protein
VAAENPRLNDLRPFGSWRHLSRLWLSGGSLASLDGVQSLTQLRQLSLRFLPVDNLAPLAELDSLEVPHLGCLAGVHDGVRPSARRPG